MNQPVSTTLMLTLALCCATATSAAELRAKRNLPYVEGGGAFQSLDVYAAGKIDQQPVIVWIHGGGWRAGDKANVAIKPQAFVDQGFVFVSVNYRLLPKATVQDQAGDVAAAIAWVHRKAQENGADAEHIFVAGHSAGAHLAALVCTDERYLKEQGLSLANVSGCIPVDTAMYNAVEQIDNVGDLRGRLYTGPFTQNPDTQRELSPASHVAQDKSIPPFLILHVASRADSTKQSQAFAKALNQAGVSAKSFAAKGKNHGTVNRDLGKPDDAPTQAVFEFLHGILDQTTDEED